jgi:cysteine-S-conjugate beta-lyase
MHWRSRLIHPAARAPEGFKSLAPAVHRGSTVLFERQADALDDWRQTELGYTYGLYGSPTVAELGARIAELEGARHSFITPGGQSALAVVYLACCRAGDHALIPDSVYGPNRDMALGLMARFGVEVEAYDPLIGADIADLIRDNTSLIWTESPGSLTFEVQDVPAICAAAHARGVLVALDNTYAAGVLFDAFAHGVDISIQALTKYVGGHSDLLLGSISVKTEELYQRVGEAWSQLGMAVSPDDAALALRGLQTLGVRLERLEASTLTIAGWLAGRPEIARVLHPAFPSCPGHEIWRRDFTGSASVFSVEFHPGFSIAQIQDLADRLALFKCGYSWGGVTSLATVGRLQRRYNPPGGVTMRLNIGLEEPDDLIADLARAFAGLSGSATEGS